MLFYRYYVSPYQIQWNLCFEYNPSKSNPTNNCTIHFFKPTTKPISEALYYLSIHKPSNILCMNQTLLSPINWHGMRKREQKRNPEDWHIACGNLYRQSIRDHHPPLIRLRQPLPIDFHRYYSIVIDPKIGMINSSLPPKYWTSSGYILHWTFSISIFATNCLPKNNIIFLDWFLGAISSFLTALLLKIVSSNLLL